MICVEKTIVT